jgi:hypothetical protein
VRKLPALLRVERSKAMALVVRLIATPVFPLWRS